MSRDPHDPASTALSGVTDSPWFWAVVFGAFALAGLAAISPKFLVRQTRLDVKHTGREQGWRNRVAGEPSTAADPATDGPGEESSRAPPGGATDRPDLTGAAPAPRVRWIVGGLALMLTLLIVVAVSQLRAQRRVPGVDAESAEHRPQHSSSASHPPPARTTAEAP